MQSYEATSLRLALIGKWKKMSLLVTTDKINFVFPDIPERYNLNGSNSITATGMQDETTCLISSTC